MNMRRIITSLAFALLLLSVSSFGQEYPEPDGFCNDFAGILGSSDEARLESLAREIQQKADIEVAFVTMDAIPEGQDIDLYTVELAHEWGVGGKDTDRGAMLLYKTGRGDGSSRQVYLAIGYGLEGDIPDAAAGRILDSVTIPFLRQGQVFAGFAATAVAVVERVRPNLELTGVGSRQLQRVRSQDRDVSPFGMIVMIILVGILMSTRTGRAILFGMILSGMFGRRGGWGGGGGFGSGGGFGGGFGGGGFGGGGAGRSF
jgi:uncharacterized protein